MTKNKTVGLQKPAPRPLVEGAGFSLFKDQKEALDSLAMRGQTRSYTVRKALDEAGICSPDLAKNNS